MPSFSAKSKASLAKARPELQKLFAAVILEIDCTVLDSERGKAAQEKAFKAGNSKAHFGQSPHNFTPSIAVDVVPYPLDWDDIAAFKKLGAVVKRKAKELGIPISWGGDWRSLKDFPHYELSPWRDWAKKSALIGTAPAKAKPVPVAAIPRSVAEQYPELVSPAEKGTDMAKSTHTAKDVQVRLNALGYNIGAAGADGSIGNDTRKALSAFQHDKNLTVTGDPDATTLSALFPESDVLQNAANQEPWYNSRIYRGLIITALGFAVNMIPQLRNAGIDVGGTVNTALDAIGPIVQTWFANPSRCHLAARRRARIPAR
jgi:peptidoglycan L-alanyl-D-glutamate endopeptidase CwlK